MGMAYYSDYSTTSSATDSCWRSWNTPYYTTNASTTTADTVWYTWCDITTAGATTIHYPSTITTWVTWSAESDEQVERVKLSKAEKRRQEQLAEVHREDRKVTSEWLKQNEVPHHRLVMGKLRADMYVDNSSRRMEEI